MTIRHRRHHGYNSDLVDVRGWSYNVYHTEWTMILYLVYRGLTYYFVLGQRGWSWFAGAG